MHSQRKVLVWTEDTQLLEQLKRVIDEFHIFQLSYPAELLALAAGKNAALVLIEIDPQHIKEGVKMVTDVRQLSQDVPIVIFSKKLSPIIINEIIPLGVYDYLLSPLNPVEIKRILLEIERGLKGQENLALLFHLSEKLEQLSAENDIIRLLNTSIELDDILEVISKKVMELVNVEASSILLFSEKKNELVFRAVRGSCAEMLKGKTLALDHGIAGWVARESKPAIVNDVRSDERFFPDIDKMTSFITKSILCVPIKAMFTTHGIIELINKEDGPFTTDDLDKISTLASFAALALNKSKYIKAERQRVEQITLLFEIGTYLSGMLNLEELLQNSAQLIRRSFDFYYIGIAIVNHEKAILELKSFDSEEQVKPKRRKVGFDQGLMGWVVRHGAPLRIDDVQHDKRYLKGIESVRSEMVIPLKRQDTILGVIDIGSKEPHAFGDNDQILTEQIARLLSISIENAMLYKKVGRLAITDDLTGLFNARYCHITLDRLKKQKISSFSIIFLDLDFFKLVNDQFGHQLGGRLLREVGSIVKKAARRRGIATRYGGDEYVIILPRISKKDAVSLATTIHETINKRAFLTNQGMNYHITASLGIAVAPEHAIDGEQVLRLADRAMYWVKNHGRNGIKMYGHDVVGVSAYAHPSAEQQPEQE
jgi:diguanylate cyclase (GGDEF)-like protein